MFAKTGEIIATGLRLLSSFCCYLPITTQFRAKVLLYCGGKKCTLMEHSGIKSQNITY